MYNREKTPKVCMKVGCRSAIIDGVGYCLEYAPREREGLVYVPVAQLPEGARATEVITVTGFGGEAVEFVEINRIEGCYVKYDTMGLIILDYDEDILSINRKEDMSFMLELMGKIIFSIPRVKMNIAQYAPATEEEREGFREAGEVAFEDLGRHYEGHPYIYTYDWIFDKLRAEYEKEGESELKTYIGKVIGACKKTVDDEKYKLNESGDGLAKPLVCTYEDPLGYDVGGRHGQAGDIAGDMTRVAFACRILGNDDYAKMAYYALRAIGTWDHWGPGHFLNCAGAAECYATVIDWLYNDWERLGLDIGPLRLALYEKGVKQGFNSVIFDMCDYPSAKQGTGWRFKNKRDNWNAVCNGGMVIASLVLLGDGVDEYITEEMIDNTKEMLGAALVSMMQDGLLFIQYAPDGSYVESPGYWSYGTNTLFRCIAALDSAVNTDYGMSKVWGLDKTCYYAINTESAEFVSWNYHDGGLGQQNTSMFLPFAFITGDHMLSAIRMRHLAQGKAVTIYDLFYSPEVRGYKVPELGALPLDYYMEGIDAMTFRSGWERGSMYAGIIGGYNPKGGSHNQVDSGAFVYHNKGVLWFTDLGSDYYNIKGGYFGNYKLYKRNGEGNNNLILREIEFGQKLDTTGYLVSHKSSEDSSYAIIDNLEVYGEENVKSAKRGMLVTDNRGTVVVQDEVEFVEPRTAYWIGHFNSAEITADLSEDGKTCVFTHKDGASVTVRLIGGERFEIMGCYDYLLDATDNFEGEHDRHGYSRLVVKYENATSINSAVVIDGGEKTGYPTIIPMDKW